MPFCSSCGAAHAAGQKFCAECGGRLVAVPAVAERERKVVTVLFCDLVGFTAASDGADPEEVQARLSPYHARARAVIEGFGGTVEKFIGDAVMAAFGVPVVHEDDPERAVRAGLALLAAVADLNADHGLELAVRIGVATGEALVSLSARPELGEGMVAGDVVNVAARLQSAAPVGGVLVGRTTYTATRAWFEFEPHEVVVAKGKSEPLAVWVAVRPRGDVGEALTDASRPMIGREDELNALQRSFRKAVREQGVQLVTVVAEPGMGKSRLLEAFGAWIEDLEEIVIWRQGRCRPYGDATACAAFAQVVRAQTGIVEGESPAAVAAKLADAVDALVGDTDLAAQARWFVSRLAPLVGLPSAQTAPEELFTAWRRFVEAMADQSPFVMVIEDLHWADPILLDFLTHLLDWTVGVPLVIVATARPELYDTSPGWGAGQRNSTSLTLAPLSPTETAQLTASLLGPAVLPPTLHAALLERAAGNPLYTREYLAMLTDAAGDTTKSPADGHTRGDPDASPAVLTGEAHDVQAIADRLPGSVQAVIAARLDTLTADAKRLLQAAAVVGPIFWVNAVATLTSTDAGSVTAVLHDLTRRDYVRPSRSTTLTGQVEYTFAHALIGDVAYGQLPRASRAAHHRRAAEWHQSRIGGPENSVASSGPADPDAAESAAVLAHHWTRAYELTAAGGASDPQLAEPAAAWQLAAARQAFPIDLGQAERHAALALSLTPPARPEVLAVLLLLGEIQRDAGRATEALETLSQAGDLARRVADDMTTATVDLRRADALWAAGQVADAVEAVDRAATMLERDPARPELAEAVLQSAFLALCEGRFNDCERLVARAVQLGEEQGGLPINVEMQLYRMQGAVRGRLGRPGAEAYLARALALARQLQHSPTIHGLLNELALIAQYRGPADAGLNYRREAVALTRERGYHWGHLFHVAELGLMFTNAGRLAEAQQTFASARRNPAVDSDARSASILRLDHAVLLLALDDPAGAVDQLVPDAGVVAGQEALVESDWLVQVLRCQATGIDITGLPDKDQARARMVELLSSDEADGDLMEILPRLARALLEAGQPHLVERIISHTATGFALADNSVQVARAGVLALSGDHPAALGMYLQAAEAWSSYGAPLEEVEALIGASNSRFAMAQDAEDLLRQAHDRAQEVGALALVRRVKVLLRSNAAAQAAKAAIETEVQQSGEDAM